MPARRDQIDVVLPPELEQAADTVRNELGITKREYVHRALAEWKPTKKTRRRRWSVRPEPGDRELLDHYKAETERGRQDILETAIRAFTKRHRKPR